MLKPADVVGDRCFVLFHGSIDPRSFKSRSGHGKALSTAATRIPSEPCSIQPEVRFPKQKDWMGVLVTAIVIHPGVL